MVPIVNAEAPSRPRETAASTACLLLIALASMALYNAGQVWNPWYLNTEEFPYVQEVIRFVSSDFRQQFFDIPGTPLIILGSIIWRACYGFYQVFGLARGQNTLSFSFSHIQILYEILRFVSLGSFFASIFVVRRIARHVTPEPCALVVAGVFAFHPIIASTIYHLRIEPFAVLLVAVSCELWLTAMETESWRRYLWAGIFAGLAAAARFPLLLAVMPAFLCSTAYLRRGSRAQRLSYAAVLVMLAGGVGAGIVALLFRLGVVHRSGVTDALLISGPEDAQAAIHLFGRLWLATGALSVAALSLCVASHAFRRLAPLRQLSAFPLLAGSAIGFLVGVPNLFWSTPFLRRSVNMFLERNHLKQPGFDGPLDVLRLYLWQKGGEFGVACTFVLVACFTIAVLVCVRRFKSPVCRAALIGCVVGVAVQFGKLQTARHIAGWLPWFMLLLAIGLDAIFRHVWHFRPAPKLVATGTIAILCIVPVGIRANDEVAPLLAFYREKISLSQNLDSWLKQNIKSYDTVFHTCCEPVAGPTIVGWMAMNGIRVPSRFLDNRHVIWFGNRTALLQVKSGYLVVSKNTYRIQYIQYYLQIDPKELVDPYTDPAFHLRAEIPAQGNEYDVFYFDFNQDSPRDLVHGMTVTAATYGSNCDLPGKSFSPAFSDATHDVAHACTGYRDCDYTVEAARLGDPAPYCAKDFSASYTCPGSPTPHRVSIPAEASGKSVRLSCDAPAMRPGGVAGDGAKGQH